MVPSWIFFHCAVTRTPKTLYFSGIFCHRYGTIHKVSCTHFCNSPEAVLRELHPCPRALQSAWGCFYGDIRGITLHPLTKVPSVYQAQSNIRKIFTASTSRSGTFLRAYLHFSLPTHSVGGAMVISPVTQMRNLKPSEVKYLDQGHTAGKWKSQVSGLL